MSNSIIDLGRSVRDLRRADELAEYTNVEFQVDNEHSVYAKAVGSVLPDSFKDWAIFKTDGQNVVVSDTGFEISVPEGTGLYTVDLAVNQPIFKYEDVSGRLVHISFDVEVVSGSGWTVYVQTYSRSNYNAEKDDGYAEGSMVSYLNWVQAAGTHSFDYTVSDTGEIARYPKRYFATLIYLASNAACTVRVKNIKVWIDSDAETMLVAKCPFADSVLARRVLALVQGFHYRPYEAPGARLDMAAEVGDVIRIDGVGFGLYGQDIVFGAECVSRLSAPFDQELEHEFPYVPSSERRFRREIKTLKAELSIASNEIAAKVSQVGGNASFGWSLLLDRWSVSANNVEVFRVTSAGAYVSGEIVATKGQIGDCVIENGILKVSGANITNINAASITAGTLNVDRIQAGSISTGKLGDGAVTANKIAGSAVTEAKIAGLAVTEGKIGGSAVTNGKLGAGAVSYSKTDSGVQGYFTKAGNAWSGVQALNDQLVNTLYANTVQLSGNLFVKDGSGNYHGFRPQQYALGTGTWVLTATS